jgi:WD40 repeat protein
VGLWEIASGKEIGRMPLTADMSSIAFSADGQHLATAGRDQTVRVWEIPAFTEVARFEMGGVVSRVVFSPDMQLVAAASSDRTARVWRWKTDPASDACTRLSRNLTRAEWKTYLGDEPYRASCPELPIPDAATASPQAASR